jgi:hypothetical protein
MGLLYEIGKVNSELNNTLGTLVSDTYENYHGNSHPTFSYSNDLYPDNFGVDVIDGSQDIFQDFLFVTKEIQDDNGPKVIANFWNNWQGYCWGVFQLLIGKLRTFYPLLC